MPHRFAPSDHLNLQRLVCKSFSVTALYALVCATLLQATAAATSSNAERSEKRGLIDIETLATAEQDNAVLINDSDISWYYNYGSMATDSLSSSSLDYVPMLWGSPGTDFYTNVTTQLTAGVNITTVMGFNEPDGCTGGGSCISAANAAKIWIEQVEPLKTKHGLKLGSPAPTGSQRGLTWLQDWYTACDGGCTPDFLTLHWYGNFEGLASWIGQVNATFLNNVTGGMWITEFALEDQPLQATQEFYNQSTVYLDNLDYVHRYAYFGSFRSDVSNVGKYVSMLSTGGELTDIGSWYKGDAATGVDPTSTSSGGSVVVAPGVVVGLVVMVSIAAMGMM